jgi:hypothetical protein
MTRPFQIANGFRREPRKLDSLRYKNCATKCCRKTALPLSYRPASFEGADENRTHDNVLPVAFAQSQQSDFKKLRNDNVVPPAFVAPGCGGANVPPARLGRAAFSPESETLAQTWLRTLLNRGEAAAGSFDLCDDKW